MTAARPARRDQFSGSGRHGLGARAPAQEAAARGPAGVADAARSSQRSVARDRIPDAAPGAQPPPPQPQEAQDTPGAVAQLSVIIPVYNERNTLRALLQRVQAQRVTWEGRTVAVEVIVVDDCSNDGGVDFLEQDEGRAIFPTVRLIRHQRNRGKGAAIRSGLAAASGDVVLIQDADLEYDPADYQALLAPLLAGDARVVYGSRFLGRRPLSRPPGMHVANWLANKLLSWTASALFSRRVTDEATCYKVISRSLFLELNLQADRFDICPEITAKVLRRGHTIYEVPITYHGRGSNDGKKIRWTDAFRAWFTLLRYRFHG